MIERRIGEDSCADPGAKSGCRRLMDLDDDAAKLKMSVLTDCGTDRGGQCKKTFGLQACCAKGGFTVCHNYQTMLESVRDRSIQASTSF